MSASRRHRGHDDHEEHENEERWLVSYADMMTLLFCLFMVLFAISSVNTSKFQALQKALQDAFSGAILSGGKAVMTTGASQTDTSTRIQATPPLEALRAATTLTTTQTANDPQSSASQAAEAKAAAQEQNDFEELKRRIDALARQQGIAKHVHTRISPDGLVVELLTDKVFFDSGSAQLKVPAVALLDKVGAVIAGEHTHPVLVEGYTDSQPIHTPRYSSNWSLSGDRAAAVVDVLHSSGVFSRRLSLKGYGAEEPVATNSTPEGRSRNRRVDVVLTRLHHSP
jgi:chemotaxis protein MotB